MSSKRTTRTSRRSQTPVNVLLTEIGPNSTCLSLSIPIQLACGVCSPRMDITSFSRKRKHNQRQLSDRRKCQQYWDDKWLSRDLQSNAKLKMYKDVRDNLNINTSYLDINSEIYVHANKYKSANPLSTHPSSSPSSPSSSSPSSSSPSPSVNYTPISSLSTPASSQESQYATILPQTLEEDYPIEEEDYPIETTPAPTLNSVNKTPMLLCQPCAEEESSIDSQMIGNIVSFLSNKTKNGGPDSYIIKITKNTVLTACLFTQSTGLDKI
jgi:hypothetical protein